MSKLYLGDDLIASLEASDIKYDSSTTVKSKIDTLNTTISGKAPTSHASSATTYGVGTTSNYGHCMTINDLTSSSYSNGKALSAYKGYVLNNSIEELNGLISDLNSDLGKDESGMTIHEKIDSIITILDGVVEGGINFLEVLYTSSTPAEYTFVDENYYLCVCCGYNSSTTWSTGVISTNCEYTALGSSQSGLSMWLVKGQNGESVTMSESTAGVHAYRFKVFRIELT